MIIPTGRLLRYFDWLWFLALLALASTGLTAIWSITYGTDTQSYFDKQIIYICCGLVLFFAMQCFDYRLLSDYIVVIYIGSIVFLCLVFFFGHGVRGNVHWLKLGTVVVQPSEFAKIGAIIALAKYYADLDSDYLELKELARGAAIIMVPAALVLFQGDLGTAITFIPIYIAISSLAGVRRKHIVAILLIAIVSVPAAWPMMRPHQKERIETIIDPYKDPHRVGYHSIQSMVAIGSGQFWGKGLKQGSQGQLGFLPANHTDFIFAVLAEEKGFVGGITILGLFLFVLSRLFRTICDARDKIGAMIVSGGAAMIFCHVAINIAMVFGVFPVIGIPLPFVSAGGSSLVTCFIVMGISMNVRIRRYVN